MYSTFRLKNQPNVRESKLANDFEQFWSQSTVDDQIHDACIKVIINHHYVN